MPKIVIKGETHPIMVSQDDANRILEQKNDLKYKGMISIGGRQIAKGNIKEISFMENMPNGKLNIDNLTDRETIKDFERWTTEIQGNYQLECDLDYYGFPLEQEKFPGVVLNDILGGVHWTLVRWAMDSKIISRKGEKTVSWGIVASGFGNTLMMDAYRALRRNLDGLTELRGRRRYAETKEMESRVEEPVEEEIKEKTEDDLGF